MSIYSAQIDPTNPNCWNVYKRGVYFTNVGAESEQAAIDLAYEIDCESREYASTVGYYDGRD